MYFIIVAILGMFACVLMAALITNPGLIVEFGVVVWRLLGRSDSPFFWMLTFPAMIMLALFVVYYLWLRLTIAPRDPKIHR